MENRAGGTVSIGCIPCRRTAPFTCLLHARKRPCGARVVNEERERRALVRRHRYREAAAPACLTTRPPVAKRALDVLGRLQASPYLRKNDLAYRNTT